MVVLNLDAEILRELENPQKAIICTSVLGPCYATCVWATPLVVDHMQEGRVGPDDCWGDENIPTEPGLWVWEGYLKLFQGDGRDLTFEGVWRRPTAQELALASGVEVSAHRKALVDLVAELDSESHLEHWNRYPGSGALKKAHKWAAHSLEKADAVVLASTSIKVEQNDG